MQSYPMDNGIRSGGEIRGQRIGPLFCRETRPYRRELQVAFPDSYTSAQRASTHSRHHRRAAVDCDVMGDRALVERIGEIASKVGLRAEALDRFAHDFSGGQRQRDRSQSRSLSYKLHKISLTCVTEVSDDPSNLVRGSVRRNSEHLRTRHRRVMSCLRKAETVRESTNSSTH